MDTKNGNQPQKMESRSYRLAEIRSGSQFSIRRWLMIREITRFIILCAIAPAAFMWGWEWIVEYLAK